MGKPGPIIIIEDDIDDETFIKEALAEINVINEVICFKQVGPVFDYLKSAKESPFIIISDINLPGQSGLYLKREIDSDIKLRSENIPFIFYSMSTSRMYEIYNDMNIQGFFQKANNFADIKKTIKVIIEYWDLCIHPNNRTDIQ